MSAGEKARVGERESGLERERERGRVGERWSARDTMRERESGRESARESWRGRDGEKKVGDRKRESGLEREGE